MRQGESEYRARVVATCLNVCVHQCFIWTRMQERYTPPPPPHPYPHPHPRYSQTPEVARPDWRTAAAVAVATVPAAAGEPARQTPGSW